MDQVRVVVALTVMLHTVARLHSFISCDMFCHQVIDHGLARWNGDKIANQEAKADFDFIPLSHNLISNSFMRQALSLLRRIVITLLRYFTIFPGRFHMQVYTNLSTCP